MKRNILIVDDSETSRMIIKKCFSMVGDDDSVFYEAEDGISALAALAKFPMDLVVTDLNMPRMDGITLVRKLRTGEKTKGLAVIVISSMENRQLDEELRNLAVAAVIRKPLTPAKVRGALVPEGGF